MPVARLLPLALGACLVAPAAIASPELARARNCVACHAMERHLYGPPFKAIAERYATDTGAVATLSARIIAGTGGNWGQTPMPPQSAVTPEDAEALVRWILSQR